VRIEVLGPAEWGVHIIGARSTIYEGEHFLLHVHFTNEYPMDAPIVVFAVPSPVHEHIYSNGHICLNILGDDWSPALTVESICLFILSMMSSAQVKVRPNGDERYSQTHPPGSNPKNTRWLFDDDRV
jgi:ubiquitin-conjugating enzyme E2 W